METTMQTWWAFRKNLISRPYVPDGDVEPSQVQVVFYADAQATVGALQAQLDKTNLENAYANNETRNTLIGGIQERDVKISALQQQVEALQRERDDAVLLRDHNLRRCDVLDSKYKKGLAAVKVLQSQLSQLQVLVRALPVVNGKLEVDSGACYYVRALDGKRNPVVCGLMTEQATAHAIMELFRYRATLDATSKAGGNK